MLLAKLTQPRSITPIPRARLFRLLDHAGKKPVTWVWALPGAGKTTLVASYLSTKKLRTLWFQVDVGDNDLATFFYYLGQAAPKRKRPMALFTPEYQMGLPIFTRNFFRELFSRLKSPFALVFDNYQEIESKSVLHEAVQGALTEVPHTGRVIFISRAEVPSQFAELRAKQSVEIIDWTELRFTRGEVNDLVKRLAPRKWPKAAIDTLHETADGWAAGLVLLLEQLRKEGQTSINANGRSSQVLFDYFAGEILKRTESETREVLLQTSFLPTVTARMAEELTGIDYAGEILATLHKQNYFTDRRAADDTTYEYHPLFREFLLAQASLVYPAERHKAIRRKAGDIVKAAGRIEAAAVLYQGAEDWDNLAQLIYENAPALLGQGRITIIEGWISALPEPFIDRNAWILYWRGMCWTQWDHPNRRRDCERAFAIFRQDCDSTGMFLAWAALTILHQSESYHTPLDDRITELEQMVREGFEFPSERIEAQVAGAMLLAITMRRPNHPDGEIWAVRALGLTAGDSNLIGRAITVFNWFMYHFQRGNFEKASTVVEEMRSLMRSDRVSSSVAVAASMTVVWYESMINCGGYRATVEEVLRLSRSLGMLHSSKNISLAGGIIGAIGDGKLRLAEEWLDEMAKDLDKFGVGFRSWYCRFTLVLALLRRDKTLCAKFGPRALRLAQAGGMPFQEHTAQLLAALASHELGLVDDVNLHVRKALDISTRMQSAYADFMTRTTEAHICFDNGEEAQGLESLRIAMELGRIGGFVNSQVWIPRIMARLCAKALEHNIEVDYARMLIKKRNLVPEESPVDIEAWPWPVKIYTLGHFVILKDDQPLQFSGKVQRKPLALLKTIIALGGKNVREDTLLDTLWPDADGDAARFALTSAIHRLRKLLGRDQAMVRQDNEISLDDRYCWIDIWAVERMLERNETLLSGNGDEPHWTRAMELLDKAIKLYKGPFLNDDPDIPSSAISDRIRRRLLRQLAQLGQHWEWKDNFEQAAALYEQGFNIDPCAEDLCRKLMTAYQRLGRPAEVLSVYTRCKNALARSLDISPSRQTESLLQSLTSA